MITDLEYLQILITNAPKYDRLHLLTHCIHETVRHVVLVYYTYMKETGNE